MDAGVIIVTYNRINLLRECLKCIACQTVPFSGICVVDNASTDGTGDFLDELAAEGLRPEGETSAGSDSIPPALPLTVFHLDKNYGGAGGFACGLKLMARESCDWLLLIDDDAMLRPDYLERLLKAVDKTGYLACSGTVETDGVIDLLHRRRLANRCLMTYRPVTAGEYRSDTFSYDIGTFCGLMLKTEMIRQIGFPKSEYFIWFDDTEYCLRFRNLSPILNVNGAVLDHRTAPAPQAPPVSWKNYYGFRNSIDIGRTYSSCPAIYLAYILVNHLAHILIDTIGGMLGNRRQERAYRRQIYTDVLRGMGRKPQGKDPRYLPGSDPISQAAKGENHD